MPNEKKKSSVNLKYLLVTRKYLVLTIAMSMAIILVFFMLIFPRVGSIQASRSQLETDRKKLAQLNQKLSILENVNSLDAYQQRQRIVDILPSSKPLLPMMAGFEKIAIDNTLTVSEFDVSPGEISTGSGEPIVRSTKAEGDNFDMIEINTTVVGEVDQINEFLYDLDLLAPLTEVTSINLTPSRRQTVNAEGISTLTFEAQLSLVSYFYTAETAFNPNQALPEIATISETVLPQLQDFTVYKAQFPSDQFNFVREDLF